MHLNHSGLRVSNNLRAAQDHGYVMRIEGNASDHQNETDNEAKRPMKRRGLAPNKFPVKRFLSQNQRQLDVHEISHHGHSRGEHQNK